MQNKWLMINIQNVQDFACQCLNRDVWSNEAVKNIIREHFIFWQVRNLRLEWLKKTAGRVNILYLTFLTNLIQTIPGQ